MGIAEGARSSTASDADIAARQADRGCVAEVAARTGRKTAAAGVGDGGIDLDIVMHLERELVIAAPSHGRIEGEVAGLAAGAVGLQRDVVVGQVGGQGVGAYAAGGLRAGARVNAEVGGVDQPGARAALDGPGGDLCAIGHLHLGAAGFNKAAIAAAVNAAGRGRIQRAADARRAMRHIGQQQNAAFFVLQGTRLHRAGVADHASRKRIGGLAGHDDLTAVGHDQLLVLHQRADGGRVHLDLQQAIGAGGQGDPVACGHRHRAQLGAQHAVVADAGGQQGDTAAVPGRDLALVADAAHRATALEIAAESVVAVPEVLVGDVQRGGDQAAHVHSCALAEDNAVGVDQPHLTVGRELAQNLAAVAAGDAVEGDVGVLVLLELHAGVFANIEAAPVDDGLAAALLHRHGIAVLADAGTTLYDAAARGQRVGANDRAGLRQR